MTTMATMFGGGKKGGVLMTLALMMIVMTLVNATSVRAADGETPMAPPTTLTTSSHSPLEEQAHRMHFVQWLNEHGKTFEAGELLHRYSVFKANARMIAEHNAKYHAGERSYRLRVNEFAALTLDEYRARLTYRSRRVELAPSGDNEQQQQQQRAPTTTTTTTIVRDPLVEMARAKNLTYPEQVDWRTRGMVTPVANQGSCGSCWTFSSTGSMEGAYAQRFGMLVEFSKQQLVDCVNNGAYDCSTGGIMTDAFEYALGDSWMQATATEGEEVTKAKAKAKAAAAAAAAAAATAAAADNSKTKNILSKIVVVTDDHDDHDNAHATSRVAAGRRVMNTAAQYPYTGTDHNVCRASGSTAVGRFQYYVNVTSFSENALVLATASRAGVAVAIDAGHSSLQFYDGGVYYEPACSSTSLNHGVLVVGYGTDASSGYDYWLVKNSWGATWGEAGYVRMRRNANNMCGIASDASYIVA